MWQDDGEHGAETIAAVVQPNEMNDYLVGLRRRA